MKNRRVMLKLSGEALALPNGGGYNEEEVRRIAKEIRSSVEKGIQIGVVIGGGNYWRGRSSKDIDRTKADQIGMLATVMNCLYVSEIFRAEGLKAIVMSQFEIGSVTEVYSKDRANKYFDEGYVVFFSAGTGLPYFSTDTGIVLKACELDVDMVLLAKSIDGVYDKDPATNPDAKRYETVTMEEVVSKQLKVIDLTASAMCLDNKIPLAVFDLKEEGAIAAAMEGNVHGTVVTV